MLSNSTQDSTQATYQEIDAQAKAEHEKQRVAAILSAFAPITLAEMGRVALQDRFEVKFLFHLNQLAQFLGELQESYSVLVVEGHTLNRYQTLYFDTDDFALYYRHHMGARNRYKIRSRQYVESGYTFLEVKHKTSKRRTTKSRIPTSGLVSVLVGGPAQFLHEHCPYRTEELSPRLWNRYLRITLVNKRERERVTLDIDLSFEWRGQRVNVPALVVAEVKQPAHACPSAFIQLMRQQGIRKAGFSKYCVGVSLLYPEIKHNKFKATQRLLAKMMYAEVDEQAAHGFAAYAPEAHRGEEYVHF